MDNRVQEIAKKLDISLDEARQLLVSDKEVDRMKSIKEVNSDLDIEQRKNAKKYTNVPRGREVSCTDAYGKKKKRTVAVDEPKQLIISIVAQALQDSGQFDNITIVHTQKTISIVKGGDTYEIDLKRKRKPKA